MTIDDRRTVAMREVGAGDDGMRLDRWFRAHFPDVGHGALEKLLRTGQVRVDGARVKANHRVSPGQIVRVPPIRNQASPPLERREPPRPSAADAEFIHRLTLYEDDAILVINKPFGLAVQGGTKTARHIDGMLASVEKDGERPRLVHRLDRDTGGVLILAKTRAAAATLGDAFKRHSVEKTYWALTIGIPRPREGTIKLPIAKRMIRTKEGEQERVVPAEGEDAKRAYTDFQTMEDAQTVAFVALKPVTGRTHQLRVHCAAMGAPIVGDRKYGGPTTRLDGVDDGLHLFCRTMRFAHPTTGEMKTMTAPLTDPMRRTWAFFGFNAERRVVWPDLGIKKSRA